MIQKPRRLLLLTLVSVATTVGVITQHSPVLRAWPMWVCAAWSLLWVGRFSFSRLLWRRMRQNKTTTIAAQDLERTSGLLVGQGYRWTPRHTANILQLIRSEGALPIATDDRGGTPALHAVGIMDSQPLTIPNSDLPSHTGIQGATGVGKSELLRLLLAQVIRQAEGPVILIDPKGGANLSSQAVAEATRLGRRVAVICPALPGISTGFNPLSTCESAVEVATRLRTLFPQSKDQFFTANPVHTLQMVAHMQRATGKDWSLRQLYRDTMIRRHRLQLLVAYLGHLKFDVSGWRGSAAPPVIHKIQDFVQQADVEDPIVDEILSLSDLSLESFTQTHSNLSLALSGLIDTDFADLFDPTPDALTWETIEREKMVLIVLTSSLLTREAGNKVGRLILQDLVGYAGQRYIRNRAINPAPITVLIDELGEVVYPDLIQAVNKLGEAAVRFVMAWQSESDISDALGRDGAQSLLANVGSRLTLRLDDHHSAETASKAYGECEVLDITDGTSMTTHGSDTNTTNAMRRQTHRKAPLVSADWFKALPKGEGYALLQGAVHQFSVPLLEAPDETIVRDAGYGALLPSSNDDSPSPGDAGVPGVEGTERDCP
ncbi:MAG: type IV secretion system DNA-binding domain-containing protein, partial [Candidatus Tectomicrobia bacterium]|nr:type IV secretion system DNA-binding domain-containing protein [Candidatus Tectomicrobia bacterium]